MSFIDWLLGRKQEKVISVNTWFKEAAEYNGVEFENLVIHGWRKNELIFACISKTANTAAQIGVKFYKGETELETHPIKTLLQMPNPYMSEFDFWAAVVIYQKLAGVAYFEKERSKGGQVVALWPLRPDWMTPVVSGNRLAAYEYRKGLPDATTLRAEDVVSFPLFDPLGLFNYWPPVAVAARVGDVDNATTDYLKLFMQQGGTPPGILKTTQRLQDAQVADIRRRWKERYGGYESWLEPAVLDMDASYQQTGSSFKDMGFDVLDGRMESRICMVLDVPPIIVGAKIGIDRATYSNYGEARKAWWQDSLIPMYANFQDVIINQILSEYEDGIDCEFDFSGVTALQEDRGSAWQRATEAWNAGGLMLNEYREILGMPDVPDGDVFKQAPAAPEPEEEPAEEEEPEEEEEEPVDEEEEAEKAFKAANPVDMRTRRKHERIIQTAMEDYFGEQMTRIKQEARNAQ